MYRRRKLAIASVILLLVMSAVVATVQATGTTRIPFKATLDLLPWRQISLDGAWFSGEPRYTKSGGSLWRQPRLGTH